MIAKAINWLFAGVTPVVLDGALYVQIAVFGTIQTCFSSDEAYKYVDPYLIFWIKTGSAVFLAGTSALKMFRSTSYSDHVEHGK